MFLPETAIVSRAENGLFLTAKISFLTLSACLTCAVIIMIFTRTAFIKNQINLFNRFKYLLFFSVRRDFVSRYRHSVLGVLWSLLNPLFTMLVMTMVFSYMFRFQIDNYPVYLLSGQIIYGFFSESTVQAMGSLVVNGSIIKKVYVPKYIFPVARVMSSLVNLAFSFLAFLIVFLLTRSDFHWTMLLAPVPIIYTLIFSLGISMLLSAMSVFFRDLTYLYGVLITLLTYLTPLFYPPEILPQWMIPIIGLNPMYHYITYFRSVTLYGTVPGLWENLVCLSFSITSLCLGAFIFFKKQDRFILYL
jgi:ABC-type polysaccharide/polyol phosphate export permease